MKGLPLRPLTLPSLRRRLLAVAALLLAPALVATTPGVAEAATRDRAEAAAGWLGRQVDPDSNLVENPTFGPDYGLTVDTVLALDAAQVGRRTARLATAALKRSVLAYTGGGVATEYYAGAFAKLLLLADAQGADPRSFGGSARADLVAQLRALECGGASRNDCATGNKGRFSDISQWGDFSATIGQSLAILALDRATRDGASTASVRFLVRQQCANGAFPEQFGQSTCTGSVDATGYAVQALMAHGGRLAEQAARNAGRWLARQQQDNGSFMANSTRNANSTALAAQALQAVGRNPKATEARRYLNRLQLRCAAPAGKRGQVEYNRAGSGDAVRATAQAVPALARVTLDEVGVGGTRRGLPRLAC